MSYDEGLIPLFSSVQFGQNGYPGQSNPWAQWQYQSAFATSMPGTGQYGKQYSPGGATGPALAQAQPGTWPPDYPPGVLGTMQSSQYELSYMLEPGVVPAQRATFGLQVPPYVTQEAQMNPMMHMRSARRGAQLRGGNYPSVEPKLPPPICSAGQMLVQTSPGNYLCVPSYRGACPPGTTRDGSHEGMPVCRHAPTRATHHRGGRFKKAVQQRLAAPTAPRHELCRQVCAHHGKGIEFHRCYQECMSPLRNNPGGRLAAAATTRGKRCGAGSPCPPGMVCINGKCVLSARLSAGAKPVRRKKKRRRNPEQRRFANQVGTAVASTLIAHAVKNALFP